MLVKLIQQYCPEGVEYVKLGDFATQWYRGAGIKKDEVYPGGIPCIRYGEIHTTYKIWFDKCVSHTDETKQPSKKYADYGDILFAITSEDIPFIGNSVAYVGKERILVGGDIVVMKHNQNPQYISYALSTSDAVQQKGKGKVKSKVVHTNVPSLKEIIIPLPPLPVQEEIVRVLDTFTELQAELQAELQKRSQQYNYYRDNLLSFEGRTDVEWKKLGEMCSVLRGKRLTKSQLSPDGRYKVFHGGIEPIGYYGECNREASTTMVINVGASAGTIGFSKDMFWSSDGCFCLSQTPLLSSRYLYYYLQTKEPYLMSRVRRAGIPTLDGKVLEDLLIPTPTLEEQQKIVDILDRFDALTTDLSAGLPAEIEKRRQQYEYYRDKLLTFKRKEA